MLRNPAKNLWCPPCTFFSRISDPDLTIEGNRNALRAYSIRAKVQFTHLAKVLMAPVPEKRKIFVFFLLVLKLTRTNNKIARANCVLVWDNHITQITLFNQQGVATCFH